MNFAWRDDSVNASIGYNPETQFYPDPELMNLAEGDDLPNDLCLAYDGAPSWATFLNGSAPDVSGTWIMCSTRSRVVLDAELLLKAFPWDVQVASVIVESKQWDVDHVEWVPAASIAQGMYPPDGPSGVTGWNIVASWSAVSPHLYPALGETYGALKAALRLQRIPDYYVTRYIWGVVFLVGMALLVLLVPGDAPDRLGFVQSSFLGIVSWQFILVSSTPVTGYNTKLDNFMVLAMSIVFVCYAWNGAWQPPPPPPHTHTLPLPLPARARSQPTRLIAPAPPNPCRCSDAHRLF